MTEFARPAHRLHEAGDPAIQAPRVTSDPAPGKGFALDEIGHLPVTTMEGEWCLKISEVSVDIASTLQQAGDVMTVNIPDLKVGDYCFVLGETLANTRAFLMSTPGVCSTEGQIGLNFFNCDDATVNPTAKTLYFLCIHRRL